MMLGDRPVSLRRFPWKTYIIIIIRPPTLFDSKSETCNNQMFNMQITDLNEDYQMWEH